MKDIIFYSIVFHGCTLLHIPGPVWMAAECRFRIPDHRSWTQNAAPQWLWVGRRQMPDDTALPDLTIGPERNDTYDPSYGYEPYWAGGEWVHLPWKGKNESDQSVSTCGGQCKQMYINYGPICGRSKKWEYKDFDNYCKLQEHDCDRVNEWLIAYRGKCQPQLKTYPKFVKSKVLQDATKYVEEFVKQYNRTQYQG